MKFNCEKCGKVDEGRFDGYWFGDRQLEGIMFIAKKNDDGTCKVRAEDDKYLATLNKKYWLKMAKEFAEDNDIFICLKCGSQIVPDDMLPDDM
jgi:predicted RNA-binding Zn-ribbon protein involved in translation (DUF1610 family)